MRHQSINDRDADRYPLLITVNWSLDTLSYFACTFIHKDLKKNKN